jgi:hypothetical protein
LAAPFDDEPRFEAGDIANGVGLDFVNSHDANDHAARGKVDKFPRAVLDEGGVLLLHSGLPLGAWAPSIAARYDFGSTHTRADDRATAVGDVPAWVWGGLVIRSGTWGCSKMSSLALP